MSRRLVLYVTVACVTVLSTLALVAQTPPPAPQSPAAPGQPAVPLLQQAGGVTAVDASYLGLLRWRLAGPSRGGRVLAVAGDPVDRMTFYQGTTGGGVWKTDDGGLNWRNVSDGFFGTGSVGAVAVAMSDPNVVYVGMGEACIRGNASHGDGVYKSVDAGKTWTRVGLEPTRHIARVRIHPRNPDVVFVAALGDAWGPSPDRGVYRSKDGGRSWDKVLFRDANTGAIDLVMDPSNPDVLYASLLELRRFPDAVDRKLAIDQIGGVDLETSSLRRSRIRHAAKAETFSNVAGTLRVPSSAHGVCRLRCHIPARVRYKHS
jgi:hypothetical protein